MTPLVGATFGAVIGLGVFVTVAALGGRLSTPAGTGRVRQLLGSERFVMALAIYLAAFLATWALTGWVVGGLVTVIVARVVPRIALTRQARAAEVAKIEAIASWCEMLRDTISASSGLHEAVRVSAAVAPAPIELPVRRLAARLHHDTLDRSLRTFADEVDHPIGDLVVASLLLAASGQGGSLSAQLTELADTARANATMRLRVEAGRARIYTSATTVGAVFSLFALGLIVLQRDFLAAFDDAAGQVMLLMIAGLMLFGWASMYRLGDFTELPGVLHDDPEAHR